MHSAAADIITVPGARTSFVGYFCFMDKESFPVGTLIPSSVANFDIDSTASYSLLSSPSLLHGHIQFADNETPLRPLLKGAQIILLKASVMLFLLPATGSINPEIGEWPIEVATPFKLLKSKAITPQLLRGNCRGPTHCCLATLPPTHRSTLLVSQSLQPTASSLKTFFR